MLSSNSILPEAANYVSFYLPEFAQLIVPYHGLCLGHGSVQVTLKDEVYPAAGPPSGFGDGPDGKQLPENPDEICQSPIADPRRMASVETDGNGAARYP